MSGKLGWVLGGALLVALAACSDDSAPSVDKGLGGDKGVGSDAKPREASAKEQGSVDQGGAKLEAAAGGCASGFAGCTTFTDGTAGAQTVSFPGFDYSPKCLRVKVGQAVTFSGSFSAHPLEQSCGPATVIASTSSGSSASFTFTKAGLYGYYCTLHGTASGSGMAGAIEVVP